MSTEKDKNKAVITVVGCDAVGIIAKISALLAEEDVNINDIADLVLALKDHGHSCEDVSDEVPRAH